LCEADAELIPRAGICWHELNRAVKAGSRTVVVLEARVEISEIEMGLGGLGLERDRFLIRGFGGFDVA
jgi:hypothetical protein